MKLDYDVVVVGYGGAGAAAAIEAHDKGAQVLLIEKQEKPGGTTTLSTGLMMIPKDAKKAKTYVERLTGSVTDKKSISVFIKEAGKNVKWLESLGATVEKLGRETIRGYPNVGRSSPGFQVEGAEEIEIYTVKGGYLAGENLFGILKSAVEKRKIKTLLNTRALKLITEKGEIRGLVASTRGKQITIMARRGIILACGGFEYNDEMKRNFLPIPLEAFGTPGNTGDGIKMSMEVGAKLWHMNAISPAFSYKIPNVGMVSHFMPTARFIYVNQDGRRFCDESSLEGHTSWMSVSNYDIKKLRYPGIPSFVIFDDLGRRAGRIGHFRSGFAKESGKTWSEDNSKEVGRGWIKKGDTPHELASKLGISPDALDETITKYNEACTTGTDSEYHRTALESLDTPPFFGIAIYPALGNTQGGPKRNSKCQVQNLEEKPIAGLYSAGSLGSIWGFLYQGGGNISECLTSGRIAGREAAKARLARDVK